MYGLNKISIQDPFMHAGGTSLSYCNEGHSGSLGSQFENPGEDDSGVLLSSHVFSFAKLEL